MCRGNFNPRAHEGHDLIWAYIQSVSSISIHVPTRGTTDIAAVTLSDKEFQSTCPRGARRSIPARLLHHAISIHVPTRGTTILACGLDHSSKFQSTCPRGARPTRTSLSGCRRISIHVPTRGTTAVTFFEPPVTLFQSTCPRGARHALMIPGFMRVDFNPRAHEGHDSHDLRMLTLASDFNPRAHEGHDLHA